VATGLNFVAEPIHDLWRNESSIFSPRHYGDPVTFASCPIARRERAAGEVRKHPAGGGSASGRQLLGGLKHIFVNVQCSPHKCSIAHQTSDVNTLFRREVAYATAPHQKRQLM